MLRCVKAGILTFVILLMAALATAQNAQAVPRPGAISWRGSPAAFVDSLYRCVLGRAPESRQAVAGWASQVTSQSSSRLNVFWSFIKSAEYKKSAWAKQKRKWYVYRNTQKGNRYYKYYAAKYSQSGGQRIGGGPYTRGVAVAIVGYYQAYHKKW